MKNLSWKLGNIEVIQIVELYDAGEIIQSGIPNATSENIKGIPWLSPNFADEEGKLHAYVQAFLIKSNGKSILIDTCNGDAKTRTDIPEWGNLQTDFLEKLAKVGVGREQIDIVACTHLHFDHVGWNTMLVEDKWIPTFPNAKYLFAKEEYDYWISKPEKEIADDLAGIEDSVRPIVEAGLADFVDTDHMLDDSIRFISTPGHTPAHVSVYIESIGEKALISGDFLHHPCQVAHPEWTTLADTIPEKGIETRNELFKRLAEEGILLLGSHFSNPVSGTVSETEDGYIFTTE